MNTNSIRKANLIDMNILKSIKQNCYREKKSTKTFYFLQQHCYKIIIILLCIVFLSYRYIPVLEAIHTPNSFNNKSFTG